MLRPDALDGRKKLYWPSMSDATVVTHPLSFGNAHVVKAPEATF